MKKSLTHWSLMLAIMLPSALLIHQMSFAQGGFSAQTTSHLQQALQSFQNDPSFVGGISAAIKVDGLASWEGATGYAARNVDAQNNLLPGGTPLTTGTLSRMYSVTKTFTAALVLELANAGVLNLHHPVSTYLPLHLVNPGLNRSVTIHQLLAHESGYSNYTDEMQFLVAVAFQPTHSWTPLEVVTFVHQLEPPGTVRRYSSTNYILLGAIIEAATGQPVEQHYRTRFISPLRLNSIYLGGREAQPPGTDLAAPHDNISPFNPIFQFTGQPTFPNAYTNISALPFQGIVSAAFTGGGLVSNASDMASWGNALFTGTATSKYTLDAMMNAIASTPDEEGDFLGYGIWKSTKMSATETFIGHDGRAPGYRSVMFFQPEKKLTIAVMTNFYGADIYAIAKALYATVPDFTCGNPNKKEEKIRLCYKTTSLCIDRNAADSFIKKGAYLGDCEVQRLQETVATRTMTSPSNDNELLVYPNPNRSTISFSFTAQSEGPVSLDLFDFYGNLVARIFKGTMMKNASRQIRFYNPGLPPGTYIASLKTISGTRQEKVIIMK